MGRNRCSELWVHAHTDTHAQTDMHTHTHSLTHSHSRCRVWACAFHRRFTPLLWAAHNGHAAVAAALLTHGADVESKDEHG